MMAGAPSRALRRLSVAAALSTYLLVVAGGIVRVSGSGLGCGVTGQDWPLCHGRLVPPADLATIIEFSHRSLATITTVLIGFLVLAAWTRYRHLRSFVAAVSAVAVLLVVQILLGAATVELKLPGGIVLVHLANALLLLGVLLYAAVVVHTAGRPAGGAARVSVRDPRATPLAQRMIAGAVGTYLLVLSGGLVVANGAGYACAGWPLCGNGLQLDDHRLAVYNLLHRAVAGVVALGLGYLAAQAMRTHRGVRGVRRAAMAVNVLLLAQIIAGAVLVETRLPAAARGVHLALASALWAAVALLAVVVQPRVLVAPQPAAEEGRLAALEPALRARTVPS